MFKLFCRLILIAFVLEASQGLPKQRYSEKTKLSSKNDNTESIAVEDEHKSGADSELDTAMDELQLGETEQLKSVTDGNKLPDKGKAVIININEEELPSTSENKSISIIKSEKSTSSLKAKKASGKSTKRTVVNHGYPISQQLDLFGKRYDDYLAEKDLPKWKKERRRKVKICQPKGGKILASKICRQIRDCYFWDSKSEPVCVSAIVNHKGREQVALCKFEWPRSAEDRYLITSPITGKLMNALFDDAITPLAEPHDITIALFDGLRETDYFMGKLEGEESTNANPDLQKIYQVTAVNMLRWADDKLIVMAQSESSTLYSSVLETLSEPVNELSKKLKVPAKAIGKAILEASSAQYHYSKSVSDPVEGTVRLVIESLKMAEVFIRRMRRQLILRGEGIKISELNILFEFCEKTGMMEVAAMLENESSAQPEIQNEMQRG